MFLPTDVILGKQDEGYNRSEPACTGDYITTKVAISKHAYAGI